MIRAAKESHGSTVDHDLNTTLPGATPSRMNRKVNPPATVMAERTLKAQARIAMALSARNMGNWGATSPPDGAAK